MSDLAWQLPGIRAFVDAVTDDLGGGSSVIIHAPPTVLDSLGDAIRCACIAEYQYLDWVDLDPDDVKTSSHAEMAASIRNVISNDCEDPGCLDRFSDAIKDQVIWVQDAKIRQWDNWVSFLEAVRQRNHSRYETERGMFCVQVPSSLPVPESDLGLTVRRWKGVVREIDSRIFTELHVVAEGSCQQSVESSIRNAIAIELGGTDIKLVRFLSGKSLDSLSNPLELLMDFSEQHAWLGNAKECWASGGSDVFRSQPFLHSCYLAKMNRKKDLQKRIWRAQLSTIFPAIEERRIELLPRVGQFLVRSDLHDGRGNKTDIEDLELGSIVHYLHATRAPTELTTELTILRDVRHELAHLRPVCKGLLGRLLSLW